MGSIRLISNTAAKAQSGKAVVAATGTSTTENDVLDPNIANGTSSWNASAGQPTGATWNWAKVANGTVDGKKNVFRATVAVQSTATGTNTGPLNGCGGNNSQGAYRTPVTPGDVWSGGITVRSSVSTQAFCELGFWLGATFVTGLTGTVLTLPAGVEVEVQVLAATVPASVDHMAVLVREWTAQDLTVGATWDLSRPHCNKGATLNAYRDGDDDDAWWSGTAAASSTIIANANTAAVVASQLSSGAAKPQILAAAANGLGKRTFTNECAYPIPAAGGPWAASYGTGGAGTTTYPTVAAFLTTLATAAPGKTYTHLPAFPAGEVVQQMQFTSASSLTGPDSGPSAGPNGGAARYPCQPGDIVSGSIFVGSSVATLIAASIEWYTSGGSIISRSSGGERTYNAGDAYRLRAGGSEGPAIAPATAASYAIVARPSNISQFGSTGLLGVWGAQMVHTYQAQPYRNGNHPDAAWSGTAGASIIPAHLTAPTRKVALLGDSMAQLAQDGGNPLPDHLAWKLGCEVYNLGRGGETTAGMALRYGALPLMVTVTSGSIPTSGTVNCTVDKATTWRDTASWDFYGTLAGVPGKLTRPVGVTGSGNPWVFTPTVYPGSPLAVPAPMPWRSTMATDYADVTVVIGGNNNESVASGQAYLTSDVVRDYKAVRTRVRANGGRLLILPAYPNSGGTTGTTQATEIAAINTALATEFGAEYLDLLSLMRSTGGLAVAGLTPTSNDNTDIANGVIPRALMQGDGIHPNETGRDVEAYFIAQYILAMDWLSAG